MVRISALFLATVFVFGLAAPASAECLGHKARTAEISTPASPSQSVAETVKPIIKQEKGS